MHQPAEKAATELIVSTVEGAVDGKAFEGYVEGLLAPRLSRGQRIRKSVGRFIHGISLERDAAN